MYQFPRWKYWLVVIVLLAGVLFFIQRNTDSEVRTYTFAPEFEFTTYDGETIRLRSKAK